VLFLLIAGTSLRMSMSPNQSWHDVAVGKLLVFASPVQLASAEVTGIDSAVGEWRGEGLLVRTDYGLFVDPLTGYQSRPGSRIVQELIDGRRARIVAFDQDDGSRFTAAHFADLGVRDRAPEKLTFVVISRGARTAEEALRMIRSIRFVAPNADE